MLLSLIVPVYNEEYYLRRCLGSLLRQGLERVGDYEIICVDDGSTDSSPAILSKYAQHYPDLIKVYVQRNKGLGPARNTGMLVAQGEYIGFVDSDDFVMDGGYGYLCEHFLEGSPDIVHFACLNLKSADDPRLKDVQLGGEVLYEGPGTEVYNRLHPAAVWSKIYKRSFIEKHGFLFEPIIYEDNMFNFHVFKRNPYVRVTNCNIYRYMQEKTESLTRMKSRTRLFRALTDCVYGLGVYNDYLTNEHGAMSSGVEWGIRGYLSTFYRRVYEARLTFKEWRSLTKVMKKYPIHTIPHRLETSVVAKSIAVMRNRSGQYYLDYLVVWFIHHYIFEKYLRGKMVEG